MIIHEDFREFAGLLNAREVKYLIVGGYAVSYYSRPRFTEDLDVWIAPTPDNAEKILRILEEFGFGNLNIEISDLIKRDRVVQLGYPPFRIDLLTGVDGLEFESSFARKKIVTL